MIRILTLSEAVSELVADGARVADGVTETVPPTTGELEVLRDLMARTERAHAESRIGG